MIPSFSLYISGRIRRRLFGFSSYMAFTVETDISSRSLRPIFTHSLRLAPLLMVSLQAVIHLLVKRVPLRRSLTMEFRR